MHETEQEQVEAIKAWFKDNGLFIVVGLVIGFGLIGGWRGWQAYQHSVEVEASNLYEEMRGAIDDAPKAKQLADKLMTEYDDSPYAAHAAMALSRYAADAADFETARNHLLWVLSSDAPEPLKHVVRLRLARLYLHEGQVPAALEQLDGAEPGAFKPLYDEVRGDAQAVVGDSDAAREAYQAALANWDNRLGDTTDIRIKLENLAAPAPAAEPAAAQEAAEEAPAEPVAAAEPVESETAPEEAAASDDDADAAEAATPETPENDS